MRQDPPSRCPRCGGLMLPDVLEDDGTVYCINCGNVIWPAVRAEAPSMPDTPERHSWPPIGRLVRLR